jgi:MFS family permease
MRQSQRFYYGWYVVGAAAAINFANASVAIAILSIFIIPIGNELDWSRTEIAGAASLGAILGAAFAPISGWIVDRIGSRLILVVGCIAIAAACLYLSVVQTLIGFYIAFTLARASELGVTSVATSTAIGKWFLLFRGRATGLIFFAESAGIIVLAPIIQFVIGTEGWRMGWVVLAGWMFAIGVLPSALFMRRQPEDMGLNVDGRLRNVASESGRTDSTNERDSKRDKQEDQEEVSWTFAQALRTSTFWLFLISLFVVSIGTSGIGVHLVPHLIQQGLSSQSAVGAISVMFAAGALASVALGFASERISPPILMILTYLLVAISVGILLVADTIPLTYLFAITSGTATIAFFIMPLLLCSSYYGRASLGSIYGVSKAVQVGGLALGPVVAGLVYDTTGSYQRAFLWFGLLALGSSLLILIARRPTLPKSGLA